MSSPQEPLPVLAWASSQSLYSCIAGANAPVADYSPAEWKKVLSINLDGAFNVNRSVVRGMADRNYGRIVNIASIAGKEAAQQGRRCGFSAQSRGMPDRSHSQDISTGTVLPVFTRFIATSVLNDFTFPDSKNNSRVNSTYWSIERTRKMSTKSHSPVT